MFWTLVASAQSLLTVYQGPPGDWVIRPQVSGAHPGLVSTTETRGGHFTGAGAVGVYLNCRNRPERPNFYPSPRSSLGN